MTSIVRFTMDHAGNPTLYYGDLPQDFLTPAVYFPAPSVQAKGGSLSAYAIEYRWNILFFHNTTSAAYDMAFRVLSAVCAARNLIPLLNAEGSPVGKGIRAGDPVLSQPKDTSKTIQLQIFWESLYPYPEMEYQTMMNFNLDMSRP